MALTLNLVKGATTLQLNGGGYGLLEDFQPKPPKFDTRTLEQIISGSLPDLTVAESVKVRVTGATVAAIQSAINAIERMLTLDAPRRQRLGTGDQVFLKFTPSGGATTWRSEILRGRVDLLPKTLAVWQWDAKDTEILVTWERRFYWESDTLTALPLTNGNGSNVTTGLNVYNASDGSGSSPNKKHNYVEIAAADVAGVLPAPVFLQLTNSFAATARRFYVGHKAQGDPANWTHILEAESATLNATYAASAADADCSNGNKVTVTNVSTSEVTLATWTITNTQAGYMLSQWIRFIARFEDKPNNSTCQVRLTLQDSTTTAIIGRTDWTTLNSSDVLQALGTLMLSPNLQGQSTLGALKLVLSAKDSAGTCDFGLDFLALMPIESGQGFRYLKPIDETLVSVPASTGVLVDNAVESVEPFVEGRQDVFAGYGGPLMLVPGSLNRLYFLHDGGDASAAITRLLSIVVKYRPRVLTV